jgi:transposase
MKDNPNLPNVGATMRLSEPRPCACQVKAARARALNISPKLLYKRQKEALTPVAAARGAELDPATAAELRQLRALARRQAQELDILKKAIASCLL